MSEGVNSVPALQELEVQEGRAAHEVTTCPVRRTAQVLGAMDVKRTVAQSVSGGAGDTGKGS